MGGYLLCYSLCEIYDYKTEIIILFINKSNSTSGSFFKKLISFILKVSYAL